MTHASGNQSNSEIVRPKLLQILIKSTNQNNSEIARLELQQIFIKSTWHHSGVDLVGLLNSPSGNRYILTLTDYFSKCVCSGRDHESSEGHHYIWDSFCHYNRPAELTTDVGARNQAQTSIMLLPSSKWSESLTRRFFHTKNCGEQCRSGAYESPTHQRWS